MNNHKQLDKSKFDENRGCQNDSLGGKSAEQEDGEPGDDLRAVEVLNTVLIGQGGDYDAVTLQAGEHPIRVTAGSMGIGTFGAIVTGLCGQTVDLLALCFQETDHLMGGGLMCRTGGQALFYVGDTADLCQRNDEQSFRIGETSCLAFRNGAYGGWTCPGLAVTGAFLLTDHADPLCKFQLLRSEKFILCNRELQ